VLYLITNDRLNSHKIGITNDAAKEKRLLKHAKEGWETYKTYFFTDGNDAFDVEQEILVWWRSELGLPIYLSNSEMPQGGFTETVDASEIDLMTIWSHIEECSKRIQSKKRLNIAPRRTSMPTKVKKNKD
jgi:hypothetical protein